MSFVPGMQQRCSLLGGTKLRGGRAGGTVASYTSCKLRVHAVAAGFCCTAVITSADAAARDNDGSPHMT